MPAGLDPGVAKTWPDTCIGPVWFGAINLWMIDTIGPWMIGNVLTTVVGISHVMILASEVGISA